VLDLGLLCRPGTFGGFRAVADFGGFVAGRRRAGFREKNDPEEAFFCLSASRAF